MKFEINNVARVKKAEIEVEGITVIAGYNGTGKSTVCKAVYAVCSAFGRLNQSVANSRRTSFINCIEEWDESLHTEENSFFWSTLADDFMDSLKRRDISLDNMTKDDLKNILDENKVSYEPKDMEKLYRSLKKVRERTFEEYASFIIERTIINCFSGQLNTLDCDEEATISLITQKATAKATVKNNKLLHSTTAQVTQGVPLYIETNSYLDTLMLTRKRTLTRKIPQNALYKNKNENITIEQYEELKEIRNICTQIMNEVTHGELVAETNREITYKEDDITENIVCSNIASGLKNILIIQKLLENGFLTQDSLLLIDEPEVNLHPEWQVKFAEILVLLHKKLGIRIILNTHSPYFMRAIEVKLAEYEIADKGKYYYMQKSDKNMFVSKEVTGKTEIVYKTMYQPLEDL